MHSTETRKFGGFSIFWQKVLIPETVRDREKRTKISDHKGYIYVRAPNFANFPNFAKFANIVDFFEKSSYLGNGK